MDTPPLRTALLDLYNGEPNLGVDALRRLLDDAGFATERFDVRAKGEVPGLEYDVYLASGGPGSPFDGEGTAWEKRYFDWIEGVWDHNARAKAQPGTASKKHVLFICHSFQMMCRFFGLGEVTKRRKRSFGIFPVHPTEAGRRDPLFAPLPDPFHAADFRAWQVTQPNRARLAELGAEVLALEKERSRPDLKRALMAVRLTPELVGTQFHPEADPEGMLRHFRRPKRRRKIEAQVGREEYARLVRRLADPNRLAPTHAQVIPAFLKGAVADLRPEAVAEAA